jgi:hypothetical protein
VWRRKCCGTVPSSVITFETMRDYAVQFGVTIVRWFFTTPFCSRLTCQPYSVKCGAKHEEGESLVDLPYLCFVPDWLAVAK